MIVLREDGSGLKNLACGFLTDMGRFNTIKYCPSRIVPKEGRMRGAGSQQQEIERLCRALCVLQTPDEAQRLLSDLCTPREIGDLAQRLEVATMLAEGTSYLGVSSATGASSTTVSRVSKCLNGAVGGYRLVLERLD